MTTHQLAKRFLSMPDMKIFISNPESAPAPLKTISVRVYSPKGYSKEQIGTHISMLDLSVGDVRPENGENIVIL
jgi:hypothetical protein